MTIMDKLLALYQVDKQLRGLTGRIDSSKQHLRAQEGKILDLETQKSGLEEERLHLKAEVANHETEIKGYDEKVAHLREQMNQAKTNKEYTAFLTEVNTYKVDRGKIEEATLGQMDKIERLDAKIEELVAAITEREKMRAAAKQEVARREKDASERLNELRQERELKATEVPKDTLAEYGRVQDYVGEEAMAPVIEENRRRMEYSCGACCMSITAETFNALMLGQRLVTCTTCGVILYVETALADSMRK
jgi:uncharacterized protein